MKNCEKGAIVLWIFFCKSCTWLALTFLWNAAAVLLWCLHEHFNFLSLSNNLICAYNLSIHKT